MRRSVSAIRADEEAGFTLIEILVVVLIIALLAGIAIPSFLGQKSKASDAAAKSQVRTAETAAETYATDHDGDYTNLNLVELQAIEATLTDTSAARLSVGPATKDSYELTSESVATTDKFTIKRTSSSAIERTCTPASEENKGGCPNGKVASAGTW